MRNHGDQSARGRNKASQWGDAPQGNSYDSHSGGRRGESSQFRSRAYTQNNPNRSRPGNQSHTTADSRSISEKLEGREGRPQEVRTSYRNSCAAHTGGGTEKGRKGSGHGFDRYEKSARPYSKGDRGHVFHPDAPKSYQGKPYSHQYRDDASANGDAPNQTFLEEVTDIHKTILEGRNPIWEALKAGRTIEKLLISSTVEEEGILPILGIARREKVKIERVPRAKLDELSPSQKHQGMIAMLPAMDYTPLDIMLENAFAATETPLFILLDELQDPHNLGAIIRTADCAGAQGIITLEHRSVGLTSTVAKVSAGALAHMPVAKVTNLTRTIEELQQRGIYVVGADAEGQCCYDVRLTGPTAIVIGNEGTGIRRLVREQCDVLAGIPLQGHVDSLNASVAAAVLIFEAVRQRAVGTK